MKEHFLILKGKKAVISNLKEIDGKIKTNAKDQLRLLQKHLCHFRQ